jgi:polysaccharide export outer membrane protein
MIFLTESFMEVDIVVTSILRTMSVLGIPNLSVSRPSEISEMGMERTRRRLTVLGTIVMVIWCLMIWSDLSEAQPAPGSTLGPPVLGPQPEVKAPGEAPAAKRPVGGSIPNSTKTEKDSLIVTPEYYIGPEDVLDIIVWRNGDLSKQVTVRPDGRISLPLLGDIEANGLTPAELTTRIANRLKQFKETPTVSVIVQAVNSYAIYVLGEVGKPGKHPLKSKTTLLQAITMAGGFTQTAARNRMVIFRLGEGKNSEEKLKASYYDIVMKDGSNQNVLLKPGDTIVVPSETMVLTD